jgi:hypothetical protein
LLNCHGRQPVGPQLLTPGLRLRCRAIFPDARWLSTLLSQQLVGQM